MLPPDGRNWQLISTHFVNYPRYEWSIYIMSVVVSLHYFSTLAAKTEAFDVFFRKKNVF
jgi:hypothetical protein